MFVHIIDENGLFVEDSFVDELTELTINTPVPDGFYKPKWDGAKWVEGLAQSEIDKLKNVIAEPTAEERLEALEAAMLDIIMGGETGV